MVLCLGWALPSRDQMLKHPAVVLPSSLTPTTKVLNFEHDSVIDAKERRVVRNGPAEPTIAIDYRFPEAKLLQVQ